MSSGKGDKAVASGKETEGKAEGVKVGEAKEGVQGAVLFCGCTDWESFSRGSTTDAKKKGGSVSKAQNGGGGEQTPPLLEPHRLNALNGVHVTHVAAGCVSCHFLAIDISGRAFTWGRNQFGQLGLGDTADRHWPIPLPSSPKKFAFVNGAVGRHHTVCVTEDGRCFAWGSNKHGQLGTGSLKSETELSPAVCALKDVTKVVCGGDFTAFLTKKVEGSPNVFTAGLPQFGQLGHGTDNEYNAKEGSVKLVYEPQPTPRAIAALKEMEITKMACGTSHSVAADSEGFVYTWGFGGHGRLGHREQKDEFKPRKVDVFFRTNILPPTAVVAAGNSFSACTAGGGQLYMWGRVKPTGDSWMYPKPVMDISGWHIRAMDSGSNISCVAAEASTISWGTATHGELGYGPQGQKSSANPKKMDSLEGLHTTNVACGMGVTLVVVNHDGSAAQEATFSKIPIFKHPQEEDESGEEEEEEEEEDAEKEEEDEEEEQGKGKKRKGQAKGRGEAASKRGRGAMGGKGGKGGKVAKGKVEVEKAPVKGKARGASKSPAKPKGKKGK